METLQVVEVATNVVKEDTGTTPPHTSTDVCSIWDADLAMLLLDTVLVTADVDVVFDTDIITSWTLEFITSWTPEF
jgi:hypothetical protein